MSPGLAWTPSAGRFSPTSIQKKGLGLEVPCKREPAPLCQGSEHQSGGGGQSRRRCVLGLRQSLVNSRGAIALLLPVPLWPPASSFLLLPFYGLPNSRQLPLQPHLHTPGYNTMASPYLTPLLGVLSRTPGLLPEQGLCVFFVLCPRFPTPRGLSRNPLKLLSPCSGLSSEGTQGPR